MGHTLPSLFSSGDGSVNRVVFHFKSERRSFPFTRVWESKRSMSPVIRPTGSFRGHPFSGRTVWSYGSCPVGVDLPIFR